MHSVLLVILTLFVLNMYAYDNLTKYITILIADACRVTIFVCPFADPPCMKDTEYSSAELGDESYLENTFSEYFWYRITAFRKQLKQ